MSEPLTIEDVYKLFEKTNKKFEQSRQEADRHAVEADRRAAELDRRLAELDEASKRTMRAVEGLTTRWGRFVEELVEPGVIRLFRAKNIDVKETYSRARVKRQGIAMEIDILAVDETEVVLVECKSRLSQDDVDYFLEKLSLFKQAFPHYKNYRAYGAVAGIEIDEGIDHYAYKQGLFVIKPSGETVEIINGEQFKPKSW
ncbi:MAG: DUF3782 domain-containing protein [Crocosphaera sp.]